MNYLVMFLFAVSLGATACTQGNKPVLVDEVQGPEETAPKGKVEVIEPQDQPQVVEGQDAEPAQQEKLQQDKSKQDDGAAAAGLKNNSQKKSQQQGEKNKVAEAPAAPEADKSKLQSVAQKQGFVFYADKIDLPKQAVDAVFPYLIKPTIRGNRYEYVYDHSQYGQEVEKLNFVYYKHADVAQPLVSHIRKSAMQVGLGKQGVLDLKNEKQLKLLELKLSAKKQGEEPLSALYAKVTKGKGLGDKKVDTLVLALLPLKYKECFEWPKATYGQWSKACKGATPEQILKALKQAKPNQSVAVAILFQNHATEAVTQASAHYQEASKNIMRLFSHHLYDVWRQGGGKVYSKYKIQHPYSKMKKLDIELDGNRVDASVSQNKKQVELKEAREHGDSQQKVTIIYELKEDV